MDLSPQQLAVISALTTGATITSAAQQSGVHRNTINLWRRNSLPFQHALADAQYDRALLFREKIEDLVDLAIATLQSILVDPGASAAVRLKAALAIITAATTPPPPLKPSPLDLAQKVHNSAQPEPSPVVPIAPTALPDQPAPHNLHNSAQSPIRRHHPKVARNAPCPCGSGLKYKRCCLDKLPLAAAA